MVTLVFNVHFIFSKQVKQVAFYDLEISWFFCRLCGFEPFYDERGDQAMFQRILKCDYDFIAPWWDDVSENAKVIVTTWLKNLGQTRNAVLPLASTCAPFWPTTCTCEDLQDFCLV